MADQDLIFPTEEEYDVVVCGTGLKECILSGLLSTQGKKVLHLDRNKYYGGTCASLNLSNLWEKFGRGTPPASFGHNRDWNVDLIPKFVMANGKLVSMLVKTKVDAYLEWNSVEGTYVYQYQEGGLFSKEKFIHKVPATDSEALKSNLLSMTEKFRCKSFFQFCMQWDSANPATHGGYQPSQTLMKKVFDDYGLCAKTVEFIGHALALYPSDEYLMHPMGPTMDKIVLYFKSFSRFGKSPFIYPIYGLQGLPESFSRLCAVHGGVFMLNKAIDGFEFGPDGKVTGVRAKTGEVARCKQVICDPSYIMQAMPETAAQQLRVTGRTIRAICILGAPIPNTHDTTSLQIIVPQNELKRKSDIYVMMVSNEHQVCAKGKYIAIVSATVETNNPEAEIAPVLRLLGNIEEKFVYVSDNIEPTTDGKASGIFVSKSYDAESHFESATDDVIQMYERITGTKLDI